MQIAKGGSMILVTGIPEWQVNALLDLERYYTGGKGEK
jgi:hypothetical protein